MNFQMEEFNLQIYSPISCMLPVLMNLICVFQLLIGYESGQVVLWDLRSKNADIRIQTPEPLKSIAWHHEGKQFMCSHTDGSLTTWSIRQNNKAIHFSQPHGKFRSSLSPCWKGPSFFKCFYCKLYVFCKEEAYINQL